MSTIPFDISLRNPDPPDPNASDRERAQDAAYDSVWDVLANYLQPNSTLSLEDAVDQVAGLWVEVNGRPGALATLPITMVEQIPYNHPSHKKLAEFIVVLYHSEKWLVGVKYDEERRRAKFRWWDEFKIYLWDEDYRPNQRFEDHEDPLLYANYCAFVANFIFPSNQRFHYPLARYALDDATRVDPTATVEVRDAWVIGAAQFIVYQAPTIFNEVLNYEKSEAERIKAKNYLSRWVARRQPPKRDPNADFVLEDWQAWKRAFGAAATDETYGKTCRDIAQQAADMMALQEKVKQNDMPTEL